MKKFLKYLSVMFCFALLGGCSEQDKDVEGRFLLGEFGVDWKKETYHLVVPIQWTGDSPIMLRSIEFVKTYPEPLTTYEEDGIKYEIFGADPSTKQTLLGETYDRELIDINGLEINGEGKFVVKLSLGDVKEDSARRLKIKYNSEGKNYEKIVEWKTLEQITTETR